MRKELTLDEALRALLDGKTVGIGDGPSELRCNMDDIRGIVVWTKGSPEPSPMRDSWAYFINGPRRINLPDAQPEPAEGQLPGEANLPPRVIEALGGHFCVLDWRGEERTAYTDEQIDTALTALYRALLDEIRIIRVGIVTHINDRLATSEKVLRGEMKRITDAAKQEVNQAGEWEKHVARQLYERLDRIEAEQKLNDSYSETCRIAFAKCEAEINKTTEYNDARLKTMWEEIEKDRMSVLQTDGAQGDINARLDRIEAELKVATEHIDFAGKELGMNREAIDTILTGLSRIEAEQKRLAERVGADHDCHAEHYAAAVKRIEQLEAAAKKMEPNAKMPGSAIRRDASGQVIIGPGSPTVEELWAEERRRSAEMKKPTLESKED